MTKKIRRSFGNAFNERPGSRLVAVESFELLHGPGDQRLVEVPQDRIHSRLVGSPIMLEPTPQHGVEDPSCLRPIQVGSIARVPMSGVLPPRLDRIAAD